jgi:translocation and assembly module TamB
VARANWVARHTRVVTAIFVGIALLAVLAFGGQAFIASDAGRAMIVRALPLYAPKSGLRVTAGRIEGNVFGTLTIHELALADPTGVFATAPVVDLAWRPWTLLDNRLTIVSATAPTMAVLRRPQLRPSADDRILPDIDIVVGRLTIGRLDLAAPVTGVREAVRIEGSGEAVRGRAKLALVATSATGGDVVRVHLDAQPDANRLDVAATIAAPAKGTLARLLALPGALDAQVAGKGTWRDWHGTATARLGRAPLADLALTETLGRVIVNGTVAPAPLLEGLGARATAGGVRVRADGRLTGRVLTARIDAASAAMTAIVTGTADFGHEIFAGVRIDARALRPAALFPRLSGRDIMLSTRVAGTFATPVADYVLTSPAFAWGTTGFTSLRATGHVVGRAPLIVPIAASVATVSGVGEAAPLLAGLRATGAFTVANRAATGPFQLAGAGISGTAVVRLAFDGDYGATFDGVIPRYAVGDLGLAHVAMKVRAFPAPGGTRVTGTVRADATRVDSGLFRSIFAGVPVVTSAVDVAPDLSVVMTDLRLVAPGLTQAGAGSLDAAGNVHVTTHGVARDYGPTALTFAGPLAVPTVDLALAAPGFGVTAVSARVAPGAAGWTVVAHGTTTVGAASLDARLAPGGTGADLVATVAGLAARGSLAIDAANLASGRLALSGSGLGGALTLVPAAGLQRADVALTANAAVVGTARIAHGTVTGHVVLGGASPVVDLHMVLGDVRAPGVVVATATATVSYANNGGSATLASAGTAGVPFTVGLDARGSGDHADINASGTIDGRPLRLDHRATVDRVGGVWRLAPVMLLTPDGRVEVAGSYGDGVRASLRADALGLSLLTLADPSFNFGGRASGTLSVALPANGLPTGTLALRVAGLTRAGLVASSAPVDVGVNAALTADAAALRAVVVAAGATVGRAQADLRLARDGTLRQRLLAAPLVGSARFDGPAQTLWALAGVEALDVRGPVALAVDAAGHLGDPRLTGTIAARKARIENLTLGTVVDNVAIDGRFTESRLDIASFTGTIGKDGKVGGSGRIDLAAERGFPLDVTATLDNAQAINRDDLRATATGTLKFHSDGGTGRISGALDIVRARYRLGRATANADVPVLAVDERNAEILGRTAPKVAKPTRWSLDVGLTARDNVAVEGLGLASFWRGSLKVTGAATAPEIAGRVQLVRGDYDFSGKRFSLTRGDVRFAGGFPPDPVIDIVAENTSSGFTAGLTLSGTARHPDIRFTSVPALPEDEVLSRVLFGSSITTLSAPEAIQLAGALASLRTNGRGVGAALDPFGAVRKGLKIDRLRALPADTLTGRKTTIAAGKYIGRRLYIELATDAQGYSATSIEVALSRSFSILSTVATLGGTSANLRVKRDY